MLLKSQNPWQRFIHIPCDCPEFFAVYRLSNHFTMNAPDDPFGSLLTPQMRAYAESSYRRNMSIQNPHLSAVVSPDPTKKQGILPDLNNLNTSDPASHHDTINKYLADHSKPRYPPPATLPCANIQVEKYSVCQNPGTKACSICKLVAYCSKVRDHIVFLASVFLTFLHAQECQKAHWRLHKQGKSVMETPARH